MSEGWWDNGYRQIYGEHEGPWHWHSGHRHEGGERWHQHGEASSVPEYSHSNLRQQPPSG